MNNTSENNFQDLMQINFSKIKFWMKISEKFEFDFSYTPLKKDNAINLNKIFNFEVSNKLNFMNIDPWWFLLTKELTPYMGSKKFDKRIINPDS